MRCPEKRHRYQREYRIQTVLQKIDEPTESRNLARSEPASGGDFGMKPAKFGRLPLLALEPRQHERQQFQVLARLVHGCDDVPDAGAVKKCEAGLQGDRCQRKPAVTVKKFVRDTGK